MALTDFESISLRPDKDRYGLVWSAVVRKDKYLAELQTGVIPQLIHLIIFDISDENKPVYEALSAYAFGETLTEENRVLLMEAVALGLNELDS